MQACAGAGRRTETRHHAELGAAGLVGALDRGRARSPGADRDGSAADDDRQGFPRQLYRGPVLPAQLRRGRALDWPISSRALHRSDGPSRPSLPASGGARTRYGARRATNFRLIFPVTVTLTGSCAVLRFAAPIGSLYF